MTKISQLSGAALLIVFASTSFATTATAASDDIVCRDKKTSIFWKFQNCDRVGKKKRIRKRTRITPIAGIPRKKQNFGGAPIDPGASKTGNSGNSSSSAGASSGRGTKP